MRRLQYTDDADHDLVEIALYIASESQNRELASVFVERLRAKCRQLASFPATLGTPRPDIRNDIRSTPSQRYVIYFRYRDDVLEVINILHASRDVIRHFEE